MDITVDNTDGNSSLNGINVKLVQYTFISANNGTSRTYKKVINSHKISKAIAKGQKKD